MSASLLPHGKVGGLWGVLNYLQFPCSVCGAGRRERPKKGTPTSWCSYCVPGPVLTLPSTGVSVGSQKSTVSRHHHLYFTYMDTEAPRGDLTCPVLIANKGSTAGIVLTSPSSQLRGCLVQWAPATCCFPRERPYGVTGHCSKGHLDTQRPGKNAQQLGDSRQGGDIFGAPPSSERRGSWLP